MNPALVVVSAALAVSAATAAARPEPLQAVAPEKVGLSSARLGRIARVVEDEIANGSTPGAVVVVARRGKIAYFESFGFLDKAKGVRMPRDAVFRVYSMMKPLVAVAAMTLVEEGRLQLTDPVSRWLPSFKSMKVAVRRSDPVSREAAYALVEAEREITIHDLLRHTSGLVYSSMTSNGAVRDALVEAGIGSSAEGGKLGASEWTERLSRVPLAHQPGTVWEYGLSTDLLGRVLEQVTGARLADVLAERVLRPLRMSDTSFFVPPDKLARLAEPLATDPANGKPIRLVDVTQAPANDMGGGGGVSTAIDYLRFCQMLLDGGRLGDVRILSRTTVSWMTADHLGTSIPAPFGPGEIVPGATEGYGFGLGFAVRPSAGIAGVPGSAGEFSWAGWGGTYFWVDPTEQLVAVYMSQTPGTARRPSRRVLKQIVTQAIAD